MLNKAVDAAVKPEVNEALPGEPAPPGSRLRRAWPLAVLAVAALALAGWYGGQRFMGAAETGAPIAEVTRGNLEVTISALGSVRAKNYVDVGAQVSGQLKTIHIEVGDRVERDQLLAEIDPVILEARVETARAQLDQLNAQLLQQEAEAELAAKQHARNRRLYAERAVSEEALDASASSDRVAQARIAALKAQIRSSQSGLEADLANLGYTRIFAPIAGTVVSLPAIEGQTLNANQTTPTILRIADLDTMTVWAEVSEADVMRLEPGMPVYFNTLGSQGERWRSTLRQVLPEPEVVNDVVLYKALIDIQNTDGRLLPEMTAQVFFVEGQARDAVLAPSAAIHKARGGKAFALVPGKDEPERREIELGLEGRTQTVVTSGLAPGDKVLLPTGNQAGRDDWANRIGRRLGGRL